MSGVIRSVFTRADARGLGHSLLLVLIVLLLSATNVAAQPYQAGVTSHQTGFVPRLPPFADKQLDELESRLEKQGIARKEIESRLWSARQGFEYRDEDIRAAVEGLDADDMRMTSCSSMFGDLLAFTYRGEVGQNRLTIKDVDCRPVDGGLTCHAARASKYFFDESPEQYFSLVKVSLDQAKAILAAYQHGGVADLPEDLQKFSYKAVRSIRAVPEGYELSLGGMNACAGGCVFTVIVSLGHRNDGVGQLKLIRVSDGMCV